MTVLLSILILSWFVLGCWLMIEDINHRCEQELEASRSAEV